MTTETCFHVPIVRAARSWLTGTSRIGLRRRKSRDPTAQRTCVEFAYDAWDNRMSRSVGGQETRFLVDTQFGLSRVVEEYRTGEGVVSSYVVGVDLISQSRDGSRRYYVQDGHSACGSSRMIPEAPTDWYTYDAFGVALDSLGSTQNDYRYRGECVIRSSAWTTWARYLDASTGRFVKPGQLHPASGRRSEHAPIRSRWADPVNHTDPTGKLTLAETLVVIAILGGLLHTAWVYTSTFHGVCPSAKCACGRVRSEVLSLSWGLGSIYHGRSLAARISHPRSTSIGSS